MDTEFYIGLNTRGMYVTDASFHILHSSVEAASHIHTQWQRFITYKYIYSRLF